MALGHPLAGRCRALGLPHAALPCPCQPPRSPLSLCPLLGMSGAPGSLPLVATHWLLRAATPRLDAGPPGHSPQQGALPSRALSPGAPALGPQPCPPAALAPGRAALLPRSCPGPGRLLLLPPRPGAPTLPQRLRSGTFAALRLARATPTPTPRAGAQPGQRGPPGRGVAAREGAAPGFPPEPLPAQLPAQALGKLSLREMVQGLES